MNYISKLKPKHLLVILIILVSVLSLYASWKDSQTIDEAAHIGAGYSYVNTRDFRLNPEHPPLMKLLAGIAITPLNLPDAKSVGGWKDASQWIYGSNLVYGSQTNYRIIMFVSRLPMIVIYLLLILAAYGLTKRLLGEWQGIAAASLIALDPNIFAHGHLVTNDILLTLMVVLYVWAAYNYYKKPQNNQLLILSLATLGVVSAKYTGVIAVFSSFLLIVIKNWPKVLKIIKAALLIFLVVAAGVWVQYIFTSNSINNEYLSNESMYKSADLHPVHQEISNKLKNISESYPFVKPLFGLPLPAFQYIKGVSSVLGHNQEGHNAYLLGNTSQMGWHYYMPVALAVKLPELIIGFIILAGIYGYKKRKNINKTKVVFVISPIIIFLSLGIFGNLNIGVRHIFPIWPFLYILAIYGVWQLKPELRNILIKLALFIGLMGCLFNPLAYLNVTGKIIEATINKPVLIDSNRDWSQDIYRLNNYIKIHNQTRVGLALFTIVGNNVMPQIDYCYLDSIESICKDGQQLPEYLFVSDTERYLNQDGYKWLKDFRQIDRIGGSISVYSTANNED